MMFLEALVIIFVFAASSFLGIVMWIAYRHHQFSHIPGPERKSFFLGNIPEVKDLTEPFTGHLNKWLNEHGPLVCVWLATEPFVAIKDIDLIKDVLVLTDYPKATKIYNLLKILIKERCLGEGLLTQFNNEKWKNQRDNVNPAFHRAYLKSLFPSYNRSADILMGKLKTFADGSTVVDMAQEMQRVALDVIAKVAFGLNMNTILDDEDKLGKACNVVFEGFQFKLKNPLYKVDFRTFELQNEYDRQMTFLRELGAKCVSERKQLLAEGKQLPNDILAMIVENAETSGNISDEILVDEFVTLIIAGQETTASLMAFMIFKLLENPQLLERLKEEINEVLGEKTKIEYEDLGRLKFMGQCIKETLRMYPPASGIDRMTPKAMNFGGYWLPKGTIVAVSVNAVHHDPKYWKDPETFNPDRWDKESAENPGIKNAYMPFSSGPRNCIGRYFAEFEAKVILARLFQTFDLSLLPDAELVIHQKTTLRPKEVPVILLKN